MLTKQYRVYIHAYFDFNFAPKILEIQALEKDKKKKKKKKKKEGMT